MNVHRILFFICVLLLYASAAGGQTDIESLKQKCRQAVDEIFDNFERDPEYRNTMEFQNSFNATRALIEEGKRRSQGKQDELLFFLFQYGQLYEAVFLPSEAKKQYEYLLDMGANATSDSARVIKAHAFGHLANINGDQGEYYLGFSQLKQAEELFESVGMEEQGYVDVLNDLGLIYTKLYRWDDARQNYQKIIDLVYNKSTGLVTPAFRAEYGKALHNLADVERNNKNFALCYRYENMALPYIEPKEPGYLLIAWAYLDDAETNRNDLKPDSAWSYLDKINPAQFEFYDHEATFYAQKGRYYLRKHRLDSALKYVSLSEQIASREGFFNEMMDACDLLIKIHHEKKDDGLELKYRAAKDSLTGTMFNKIQAFNREEFIYNETIKTLQKKNERLFVSFMIIMVAIMICVFVLTYFNVRGLYNKIILLQQYIINLKKPTING